MKKSIITIVILAIILATGVGAWKWKSAKKAQISKQNETQKQPNNLQPQSITEDQLVGYEIPELGIKFKVTPDTKNDLKYDFKKYNTKFPVMEVMSNSFYSFSERQNSKCLLSEVGYTCGRFDITSVAKDSANTYKKATNKDWCINSGGNEFMNILNDNIFCFYVNSLILDRILTNEEYRQMFHIENTEQDKEFGIYFETVEAIVKN